MKKSIFSKDKKYTFSDYFDLKSPTEEIVEEFGYSFSSAIIPLPEYRQYDRDRIKNLQETYYAILPKITLTSEIAKREFLIAPLLIEVVQHTDSRINVEYPLDVDEKLSGSLDYLLRSEQDLIIIEAKKGEIDKGFNQLAAELIALDKYEDDRSAEVFYGAVATGDIWKFGILSRQPKHLTKDIHSYRIPEDTETIFAILLGILNISS